MNQMYEVFLKGCTTAATPHLVMFLMDLAVLLVDLVVLTVAPESKEEEECDAALKLTIAKHKGNLAAHAG